MATMNKTRARRVRRAARKKATWGKPAGTPVAEAWQYTDRLGQVLFVSDGLSNGDRWGTFWRKTNGSLCRLKSPRLPMRPTFAEAQDDLDVYAARGKLRGEPCPGTVSTPEHLVGEQSGALSNANGKTPDTRDAFDRALAKQAVEGLTDPQSVMLRHIASRLDKMTRQEWYTTKEFIGPAAQPRDLKTLRALAAKGFLRQYSTIAGTSWSLTTEGRAAVSIGTEEPTKPRRGESPKEPAKTQDSSPKTSSASRRLGGSTSTALVPAKTQDPRPKPSSAIIETTAVEPLTAKERKLFAECEEAIRSAQRTAVAEVGARLVTIIERKLYRERFPDFDSYCKTIWGYRRGYAYKLAQASRVIEKLAHNKRGRELGRLITNEAQARELGAAENPEDAAEILERAAKAAPKTDGRPVLTAALLGQTRTEYYAPPEDLERKAERKGGQSGKSGQSSVVSGPSPSLARMVREGWRAKLDDIAARIRTLFNGPLPDVCRDELVQLLQSLAREVRP